MSRCHDAMINVLISGSDPLSAKLHRERGKVTDKNNPGWPEIKYTITLSLLNTFTIYIVIQFCEAQGKGRVKGRLRKSIVDCRLSIFDC